METFNPVTFAMNRKQELMNNERIEPNRSVPEAAASLIISQNSSDGFLDISVLPPKGEAHYDGLSFANMSPQHIAVVEAMQLLQTLLFGEDSLEEEEVELVSINGMEL